MPESVLDEDDEFIKYYSKAKADPPKMIALTARGVDKMMARQGILGAQFDKHCRSSIDAAHPKSTSYPVNAEDDVSEAAPKEGTIFFKGKVSGKWLISVILVLITVGGTFGVMKLMGQ